MNNTLLSRLGEFTRRSELPIELTCDKDITKIRLGDFPHRLVVIWDSMNALTCVIKILKDIVPHIKDLYNIEIESKGYSVSMVGEEIWYRKESSGAKKRAQLTTLVVELINIFEGVINE